MDSARRSTTFNTTDIRWHFLNHDALEFHSQSSLLEQLPTHFSAAQQSDAEAIRRSRQSGTASRIFGQSLS